jgi:hypothetical protein
MVGKLRVARCGLRVGSRGGCFPLSPYPPLPVIRGRAGVGVLRISRGSRDYPAPLPFGLRSPITNLLSTFHSLLSRAAPGYSLISPDFSFFQQDFLIAFPSRTSPASRLRVKPSQKPFRAYRFSNSVAALAALCISRGTSNCLPWPVRSINRIFSLSPACI